MSLGSFCAGVKKSILNGSLRSLRGLGAASAASAIPNGYSSIVRIEMIKRHTTSNDLSELPVFRSGPVLEE